MGKTHKTKKKQRQADDKRNKERAREVAARLLGQPPPPKPVVLRHWKTLVGGRDENLFSQWLNEQSNRARTKVLCKS